MSLVVILSPKSTPVAVSSIKEASRAVVNFINTQGWGSNRWHGQGKTDKGLQPGAIVENGVQIAFVSYNGRVWEGVDTGKLGGKEIPV